MKNKAGVILFIVEGPSDTTALIPYIEEKVKKNKLKVTVKEMHGDILTSYLKDTNNFEVSASNIISKIKELIIDYLKTPSIKAEQIKPNNIVKVYYITDTDDCFFRTEKDAINKKIV